MKVNHMLTKILKNEIVIVTAILVIALAVFFVLQQYLTVKKAHSTFENYYAFRGCTQLLSKTSDYGICKIDSGQAIKIVKYQNKWYLDGDLPVCYFNFCF